MDRSPNSAGPSLPAVLPVGTAVVVRQDVHGHGGQATCRGGAVGVVAQAPTDAEGMYRIRLPGGEEVSLPREGFQVLRRFQQQGMLDAAGLAECDLRQYVIYRCIVGSRAYGLSREGSDVDRRGIYLPPAALQWSLFGVPGQVEDQAADECYWELGKFLALALKANPNILEVLYSPLVEHATPLARELLAMRSAFLSRLVYQSFNGYVLSQFKKIEQDLRNHGRIRWKHAMHLVRLLLEGISILRTGEVEVRVAGPHRGRLLSVLAGGEPWERVNQWRIALHGEFDAAFQQTALPPQPDYEAANAFLVRARRSMVE